MTPERKAELRAICEQATPGRWEAIQNDDPRGQPSPFYLALVATVEHSPDRYLAVVAKDRETVSREEWPANCDLIATARTALPELLDEVDAAEKERDEARAVFNPTKNKTALSRRELSALFVEANNRTERVERERDRVRDVLRRVLDAPLVAPSPSMPGGKFVAAVCWFLLPTDLRAEAEAVLGGKT